jgi:lipoprotein Spr
MFKNLFVALSTFFICGAVAAQVSQKSEVTKPALGFIEGLQFMKLSGSMPTNVAKTPVVDTTSGFRNDISNNLRKTLGMALETFMPFQFKYAILLNESVEKISNVMLYKTIDDWYGTRYRYGGTTTRGIDCSAFMQVLSGYAFGWMLPRTAHEQYRMMTPISKDKLQEGDFVFFNTRGGISHVGMYLQNNKFVHSSSSQGVSIGDLTDKYWRSKFVGAKRINGNVERLPVF